MYYEISINDFCFLLSEGQIVTESVKHNVRLDKGNSAFQGQQTHVHVDNYVWNVDGSRSHRNKWPNKAPSKEIKKIAANELGISMSLLESYLDANVLITAEPLLDGLLNESSEVLGEPLFG